ncbi:MAG: hypothetical protein ABL940_01280 [Bacteroidia bacterium]
MSTTAMKLNKTHIIILLFILYCVLTYFMMELLVQQSIDKNEMKDTGIIEVILAALYEIFLGIISYFILINISSIIGLIISIKRKDTLAIQAFKITTTLTAIVTFACFYLLNIGV